VQFFKKKPIFFFVCTENAFFFGGAQNMLEMGQNGGPNLGKPVEKKNIEILHALDSVETDSCKVIQTRPVTLFPVGDTPQRD
jgi:hypothetical protein